MVGLATFLFASPVRSEPLRLTVGVGTDVPLGLGALVDAEVGPRIRFGVSAFWLPPGYVALADEVGQAAGGYNDITSALVRAATENALTLRLRSGWRPFADQGFFVEVSYTLLALGGAFSSEDLAGASGQDPMGSDEAGWDLSSTVHQVGFELGWRFVLPRQLSLRVGIGASFTVAADVSAESRDPQRPMITDAIAVVGAEYLEQTYTRYVHVPVVSLAVGWDVLGADADD